MGDRGNVFFKYEDGNIIYFYTHWQGSKLKQTVKDALTRGKERWNDEAYLARIVFSEMIKDDIEDVTGYGIAPYETDLGARVEIDVRKQTVDGIPFADYIAQDIKEDDENGL